MTLTPAQREKAMLLASHSVSASDIAYCLGLDRNKFDSAVATDRQLSKALGSPRRVGYEGAYRHSVEYFMKDLKRDGAVLTPRKYDEYELQRTLRITCQCGNALAVLHHAGRDVAANECDSIRARINACGCMRATHTNKPKNRGNRNRV
jgi:hypothetical protein